MSVITTVVYKEFDVYNWSYYMTSYIKDMKGPHMMCIDCMIRSLI